MASVLIAGFSKTIAVKGVTRVSAKWFSEAVVPGVDTNSLNQKLPQNFYFSDNFDEGRKQRLMTDMKVHEEYISTEEEDSLLGELEPVMKRLRYEKSHWDKAIAKYRETERQQWSETNKKIIDRIKKLAFAEGKVPLRHVHVLDLHADGVIKPHVDSVKFCGDVIAGLSLLSDSVMRLRYEKCKEQFVDVLLYRRSLYVMTGSARYDYTHEILAGDESRFMSVPVPRGRRISVICRNEP